MMIGDGDVSVMPGLRAMGDELEGGGERTSGVVVVFSPRTT